MILPTVGGEGRAPPFLGHGQLDRDADRLFEATELGIILRSLGGSGDESRVFLDLSNNRRERGQGVAIPRSSP